MFPECDFNAAALLMDPHCSTEEYLSQLDDGLPGESNEPVYVWEGKIQRTWLDIDEATSDVSPKVRAREARQTRIRTIRTGNEKGIIRHMYIILDISTSMKCKDLRPSRETVAIEALCAFVIQFFQENPLSKLGVVISRGDRIAHRLSDLSSNPQQQCERLRGLLEPPTPGSNQEVPVLGDEFSLQNSLDMVLRGFSHSSVSYGTKEVLVVVGALCTVDPGNVFDTMTQCRKARVRCSVLSLSAEVFVFKKLTKLTSGEYSVSQSPSHLSECLMEHVSPKDVDMMIDRSSVRSWVDMSFPCRVQNVYPSYCACHKEFQYSGYICPECNSFYCEVPTLCGVCDTSLVSSCHLARSYHHLFPVQVFNEVSPKQAQCYSCETHIDVDTELVLECPECQLLYCDSCDQFIHDSLFNCPGCIIAPSP